MAATRACITTTGLTEKDVDAIVVVGGSSQIPLVAQMISTEFELPLVNCERPGAAIALGAAQFAELADQAEPVPVAAMGGSPAAGGYCWLGGSPSAGACADRAADPTPMPAAGWVAHPAPAPAAHWAADPMPVPTTGWATHRAPALAGEFLATASAPPPDGAKAARPAWQAGQTDVDKLESTVPRRRHDESTLVPRSPVKPVAAGPAVSETDGNAEQPRGGRHRIRSRRRYWVRTTGIVASVCGVLLLGSSVVGSKAAEPQPNSSQEQVGVGSASPPPTARPASDSSATQVDSSSGSAGPLPGGHRAARCNSCCAGTESNVAGLGRARGRPSGGKCACGRGRPGCPVRTTAIQPSPIDS